MKWDRTQFFGYCNIMSAGRDVTLWENSSPFPFSQLKPDHHGQQFDTVGPLGAHCVLILRRYIPPHFFICTAEEAGAHFPGNRVSFINFFIVVSEKSCPSSAPCNFGCPSSSTSEIQHLCHSKKNFWCVYCQSSSSFDFLIIFWWVNKTKYLWKTRLPDCAIFFFLFGLNRSAVALCVVMVTSH